MIDPTDRKLLTALAPGLPLTPAPYAEVASWLDLTEFPERVLALVQRAISAR